MKYLISILTSIITCYAYADTTYEPNYIYGSQPLGTYFGGLNQNTYSGIFIPNTIVTPSYTPQAGVPMEMSQFIQGQEQLMLSHAKDKLEQQKREREIGLKLQDEYYRQIHTSSVFKIESANY